MAKQPNELTDKQRIFCEEYLIDFNATRAAIAAGYSEKTARKIGSENLTKPDIQNYLNQKREEISKRHDVTMDRIIQEYAHIAFQDTAELFDGSVLKEVSELPEHVTRALSEVTVQSVKSFGEGDNKKIAEVIKVKSHDKKGALDSLTRILGGFEKDNEQTKPETVVQVTRKIVKAK